ncbi:MAG: hypothetical protein AAGB22_15245, partial [Bacteroidota bacterium]
GLQIEQNGEVDISQEQYLAFDRPFDSKAGITFNTDTTFRIGNFKLNYFRIFLSATYKSGLRYTPHRLDGFNDLGRPLYVPETDKPFEKVGSSWFWTDLKISKDFVLNDGRTGLTLSIEVRNLFDNENAQIINPVTGDAYQEGDDVPVGTRDPRFIGPEERGLPPDNPARFLAPRQILYGISFRF